MDTLELKFENLSIFSMFPLEVLNNYIFARNSVRINILSE